ncbi:MAG: hypothetical protein IKK83_04595 [Clostridia bacterium]|nr:hypothetical protein [Clostridia bacterium]
MYLYRPKIDMGQYVCMIVCIAIISILARRTALYILPFDFGPYLIIFICGVFAVFFCVRYVFRQYEYTIEFDTLCIYTSFLGGKQKRVFSLDLMADHVQTVIPLHLPNAKYINHRQNMNALSTYIYYRVDGELFCLVFEPDERFNNVVGYVLDSQRKKRAEERHAHVRKLVRLLKSELMSVMTPDDLNMSPADLSKMFEELVTVMIQTSVKRILDDEKQIMRKRKAKEKEQAKKKKKD